MMSVVVVATVVIIIDIFIFSMTLATHQQATQTM